MTSDILTDPVVQQQANTAGFASVEAYLQVLVDRDRERLAVAEGIAAMREGRVRPFDEFDREFRAEHNLQPRD